MLTTRAHGPFEAAVWPALALTLVFGFGTPVSGAQPAPSTTTSENRANSPVAGAPVPTPMAARTPSTRWNPLDAQAPVPAVVHRSALRPSAAEPIPVGSWLNANRVVEEAGGWRAYLKEAHGIPSGPEKAK